MIPPETLEEALALIAMLQKAREAAIDQRELARKQANEVVRGFQVRADALKEVMRQAKLALLALDEWVPASPTTRHPRELATAAIEALDKALTR